MKIFVVNIHGFFYFYRTFQISVLTIYPRFEHVKSYNNQTKGESHVNPVGGIQ